MANRITSTVFENLRRRLAEAERELSPEERRQILAARAKALAKQPVLKKQQEVMEVVAFRVGGERYAVPIERIDKILEIKGLATLVGAPRHVLGAIIAPSKILAVLDLRQMLGLQGGGMTDLTKVIAISDGEDLFGLAVEDVEGKLDLSIQQKSSSQCGGPFLFVTNDRLAVLDISVLIGPNPDIDLAMGRIQ